MILGCACGGDGEEPLPCEEGAVRVPRPSLFSPIAIQKLAIAEVPRILPRSVGLDQDFLQQSPVLVQANIYWIRGVTYDSQGRMERSMNGSQLSWQQKFVKDMLGVYHVGIQVYDSEYTFGNYHAPEGRYLGGDASGVCAHMPCKAGMHLEFRESIALGETRLSFSQVEACAGLLGKEEFTKVAYNRIHLNCVDFCQKLARKLGTSELPSWCYRGAAAARMMQSRFGFQDKQPQTTVAEYVGKPVRPTEATLEALTEQLFGLHDLNANGVLEEDELIKLNEKIAMLHYGKGIDKKAIREKYSDLFRKKLDKGGRPVPYETFRDYMVKVLTEIDRDPAAQEMILEQWIAEAECARTVFHCRSFQSISDAAFISSIPFSEDMIFGVTPESYTGDALSWIANKPARMNSHQCELPSLPETGAFQYEPL
mmetsp:Transcript_32787/g.59947  ORF Transcript_32787/g.59947 Transcript_32787/m.59947 type:complete len:425 (-) Transcript_32787:105-1379(-)